MSGEGKTIPEADSIAVDQVRSAFKRWRNLEEEKARVADDLKELFAEQKSLGYDTKAMRAAFRLKVKMDEADPAEAEHEALVDTYLAALEAPRAPRAYARENIEEFDAETGEVTAKLIATVATGMQTEIGRKALVTALDIMIEREEAEETHERPSTNDEPSPEAGPQAEASPAGTGTGTLADREGRHEGEAVSADLPTHSDQPLTGGSNARQDHHEVDDFRRQALTKENDQTINHAGGDDVDGGAERADLNTENITGEGTANTALPANSGFAMEYVPPFGMKRLQFHGCFPDLSKAEYDRLEKDIAANRVQKPIIRQGDVIVDGWNRYNISRELGFNYPVQPYSGTDVLLDVIEMQRASRNFTPAQEKKIAADLAKEFPRRADEIMAAFGLAEALEAAE
jgi:uncharacterized protein (UPF0335 family)